MKIGQKLRSLEKKGPIFDSPCIKNQKQLLDEPFSVTNSGKNTEITVSFEWNWKISSKNSDKQRFLKNIWFWNFKHPIICKSIQRKVWKSLKGLSIFTLNSSVSSISYFCLWADHGLKFSNLLLKHFLNVVARDFNFAGLLSEIWHV